MLTAERVARPKAIYTFAHAPDSKWRIGRLACINAYWFGRGAHWRAILVSLLFVGATLVASKDAVLLQGRVMTAGSIFPLGAPPAMDGRRYRCQPDWTWSVSRGRYSFAPARWVRRRTGK